MSNVDLSTVVSLYDSTSFDGTALVGAPPSGGKTFIFPLEFDPATTYTVEVDIDGGGATGGQLYSALGPTPADVDNSNWRELAVDDGIIESGTGTFVFTMGPGLRGWNAAVADGERYVIFNFGPSNITAIRVTPPVGGETPPEDEEPAPALRGGRSREGYGIATWQPAVVPAPLVAAAGHRMIRASAFGPVTMLGTRPTYTTSKAYAPRARQRILVGGKDITYWRGVITPEADLQLAEPLLYGPGSVALPQVAACFKKPGAGALRFMRKWAPVVVQLVNSDNVVVDELYRGFVLAYDTSGKDFVLEFGGEAQGRAQLRDKQETIFRDVLDLGRLWWRAITDLGLRFEPRLGPETGIPIGTFGAMGHLDYIGELSARGWTRAGNQWTCMPDEQGVYRLARKDTTTVHFTVFADDVRAVADLRRDAAEEPNRIYARGITPAGQRVRFGVYPGLRQSKPAPYPFTDGRAFGDGTTNADTDTGDGIAVLLGRLTMLGYLSMADRPGGYDQDVHDAIFDLQDDAGFFDNGFGSTPPGWVDVKTWRALYDLDSTDYSLTGSHIEPAAQRRSVRRYRRTPSGAIMGRNPHYDPHAIPTDLTLDMGSGFKRQQMREYAQAELTREDNWVGTITLRTGAVLAGDVPVGATVTPAMLLDARRIKPGMNARLPLFAGGITVHVADVTLREGEVSLLVDTQARDAPKVWEVLNAHRETRSDPARRWRGNRASSQVKDAVDVWDEIGGVLDGDVQLHRGWNVIPVVAGQEGTVSRLRLIVQTVTSSGGTIAVDGREFACAVFGRPITPKRLQHLIGNPLAASPEATADRDPDTEVPTDGDGDTAGDKADPPAPAGAVGPWWEKRGVAAKLRERDILYSAGTREQPCGYSPGKKHWKTTTKTVLNPDYVYNADPAPDTTRDEFIDVPNPNYNPDADADNIGTDDDEFIKAPNPNYNPNAPEATTNDETITVTTEESWGTVTGMHRDDAGFSYRTGPQPVLYLAVWVWGPGRTLSGGRVMWNQLEAGA